VSSTSTVKRKKDKKAEKPKRPVLDFITGVGKVTGGTILGITMISSSLIAGGLVGLAISFRNLPDVRQLKNYVPTETSYIYDLKGKPLTSIHGEANREVVPLEKISPNLKRALMAIEDSHFYQHNGINLNSIGRALKANWEKGAVREGGSTLTMQLVKNLFLSQKRTFTRKLAEMVLAIRLEQVFEKKEILEMYLNQVYWGHNNYGVETAAKSYFGKSASDLNLAEGAMMGGMIQAPEEYSPFLQLKSDKRQFSCTDKDAPLVTCQRQAQVLNRMVELGWITNQEKKEAQQQTIKLGELTSWSGSELPMITDAVMVELTEKFGREAVQKGGMRVQTTIDYKFQQMAQETVDRQHRNLRGSGVRADQMALVAIDPRTHYVKALIGGVSSKKSKFNRATQSRRQPGSSFKPFVYYTAFATGKYTPDSSVPDYKITFREGGEYYTPKNYDNSYGGTMSIRTALAQSRNVPVVWLGKKVGLDKVIEVCRTLGIKSPIQPVMSLPLGAIGVTPLEMANAFATFASNGWYSEPTLIVRVTDSSGNVLLDNTPKPRLVLDPWASASLTNALQSVINGGTGKYASLGRPAAGKTGTTSSERDIWFVGYVPQLATAVWAGNDNYRPIGRGATGGMNIAPIWRSFMVKALDGVPAESFASPGQFRKPSQ
jgi:penicillin-binding protein 1A